jgi:hypothetical protein
VEGARKNRYGRRLARDHIAPRFPARLLIFRPIVLTVMTTMLDVADFVAEERAVVGQTALLATDEKRSLAAGCHDRVPPVVRYLNNLPSCNDGYALHVHVQASACDTRLSAVATRVVSCSRYINRGTDTIQTMEECYKMADSFAMGCNPTVD